jgi:hypothetical protein
MGNRTMTATDATQYSETITALLDITIPQLLGSPVSNFLKQENTPEDNSTWLEKTRGC